MSYTKEFKNQVRRTAYENPGLTYVEIGKMYHISESSVRRWCMNLDPESLNVASDELIQENVRLSKSRQHLMDRNRIERKSFREYARAEGMLEELNQALITVLENHRFTDLPLPRISPTDHAPVGILQISDNHLNELIREVEGNKFDFDVAAKRLHKFTTKAIRTFRASKVTRVCVAFTGDLINSDRRLDEITAAAVPRANSVLLAVDIYQQLINMVAKYFEVTVASITGNESRVKEFVHWSDYLASDSYDILIHNILSYLYQGVDHVKFVPIQNPLEQVLHINGANILMVHGNAHKGIAVTARVENEVEKIKARYASNGVRIDYVIMGHIHSAYIGDLFARSSGLPGGNAYSERALNLNSRASQNIFIVDESGCVDGMKIDLQDAGDYEGFKVNTSLVDYRALTRQQVYEGTTIIKVVI